MLIQITAEQLRKALADIEAAEQNGFMWCEAVFDASHVDGLGNLCMRYDSMIEKAHPTNGWLNWGRLQGVTRRHKFVDGQLIELESQAGSERPR